MPGVQQQRRQARFAGRVPKEGVLCTVSDETAQPRLNA
jgi:hypothetical protein